MQQSATTSNKRNVPLFFIVTSQEQVRSNRHSTKNMSMIDGWEKSYNRVWSKNPEDLHLPSYREECNHTNRTMHDAYH